MIRHAVLHLLTLLHTVRPLVAQLLTALWSHHGTIKDGMSHPRMKAQSTCDTKEMSTQ
jgi:hypothetical protein